MDCHPQNPEFRNNPENFHPCILVLMAYAQKTPLGMHALVSSRLEV